MCVCLCAVNRVEKAVGHVYSPLHQVLQNPLIHRTNSSVHSTIKTTFFNFALSDMNARQIGLIVKHTVLQLVTTFLPYATEQSSSSQADMNQQVKKLLACNLEAHCHVYKNPPPPVHILYHINPVHTLTLCSHIKISISTTPSCPQVVTLTVCMPSFSLLSHPCYMTRSSHASQFDDTNNIL